MENFNLVGLLVLTLFVLTKDVLAPLIKRYNHGNGNPIKIETFYQEFKDFKETNCKWCDKTDERLEKLEEKI